MSPGRVGGVPNGPVQGTNGRVDTPGERHVGSSKRPPEQRAGRSTGQRDLVFVAMAAVVVFFVGVLSGGFRLLAIGLLAAPPSMTADLLGFLAIFAVVAAAVAVLRWRQAAREQRLRALTERRFQTVVE